MDIKIKMSTSTSNAVAVKDFTEGSMGSDCPAKPVAMTREKAKFIIRMVISELDELACTVCEDAEDRDRFMSECLDTRDKCKNFTYETPVDLIAAQFDALVDAWYYSLNTSAQHGVNLSSIFDLVHKANMDKRDPETGKFIRRELDGKVIKPAGWKAPDVEGEIARQLREGSW
jgi:predicted HAD superfamily Cof-like phosphohydrolase